MSEKPPLYRLNTGVSTSQTLANLSAAREFDPAHDVDALNQRVAALTDLVAALQLQLAEAEQELAQKDDSQIKQIESKCNELLERLHEEQKKSRSLAAKNEEAQAANASLRTEKEALRRENQALKKILPVERYDYTNICQQLSTLDFDFNKFVRYSVPPEHMMVGRIRRIPRSIGREHRPPVRDGGGGHSRGRGGGGGRGEGGGRGGGRWPGRGGGRGGWGLDLDALPAVPPVGERRPGEEAPLDGGGGAGGETSPSEEAPPVGEATPVGERRPGGEASLGGRGEPSGEVLPSGEEVPESGADAMDWRATGEPTGSGGEGDAVQQMEVEEAKEEADKVMSEVAGQQEGKESGRRSSARLRASGTAQEAGGTEQEQGAGEEVDLPDHWVKKYVATDENDKKKWKKMYGNLPQEQQERIDNYDKLMNELTVAIHGGGGKRKESKGLPEEQVVDRALSIAQLQIFRLHTADLTWGSEEIKDILNLNRAGTSGATSKQMIYKAVDEIKERLKAKCGVDIGIEPIPRATAYGPLMLKCHMTGTSIDCSQVNCLAGQTPNIHPAFEALDPNTGVLSIQGYEPVEDAVILLDVARDIVVVEKKGNVREFVRVEDERKEGVIMVGTSGIISQDIINVVKCIWLKLRERTGECRPVFAALDQNPNGHLTAIRMEEAGIDVEMIMGLPSTTDELLAKGELDEMPKLTRKMKTQMEKQIQRSETYGEILRHDVAVNVEQQLSQKNPTLTGIILNKIKGWKP